MSQSLMLIGLPSFDENLQKPCNVKQVTHDSQIVKYLILKQEI